MSPTSWLAIPLVRLASSSPWNWVVTLLQDLEGDRPEGGQLGMGCGADTSSIIIYHHHHHHRHRHYHHQSL